MSQGLDRVRADDAKDRDQTAQAAIIFSPKNVSQNAPRPPISEAGRRKNGGAGADSLRTVPPLLGARGTLSEF